MAESNETLSRRVAEAAGWHIVNGLTWALGIRRCFTHQLPKYAESLDAIAALERAEGFHAIVINRWADSLWSAEVTHGDAGAFYAEADTEARARCYAYLAYKEQTND